MNFEDEKDYIMRIIKEAARILFSLMFGKHYVSVEEEIRNKYEVSGKSLDELLAMIDNGEINKAENIILYGMDHKNKEDVAAAILFYEYLSEKGEAFLKQHEYSKEEVLDGLRQIVKKAGYGDFLNILE